MTLPYEMIGRAVVFIAVVIVVLVGAFGTLFILLVVWNRAWVGLSNKMWQGYEPHENHPGLWRTRVAAFATGMANFEFRKIPAALREAREIADTSDNDK